MGRRRTLPEVWPLRMDVVEGMIKQGRSVEEIVLMTGLTTNAVKDTLTLLRKAGRLENKREAEKREREPDRQWRMKVVAWMLRHGFSQKDVGELFEIRSQRIQQIVRDQIVPELGRDAVKPRKKFWSISKAAAAVGVSHGLVADIIRAKEIPFELYYGRVRITEEGVAKLKEHPRVTGISHCVICGKEFRIDHREPGEPRQGGTPHKICDNPDCRKEYDRRQIEAIKSRGASNMRLQGWREKAWQMLKAAPDLNGDEQWVGLNEALKYSGGLSIMQVSWLRQTGLVQTQPHPKRKRNGKPHSLYALSQVQTAGEAFQNWKRANGQ